MVTRACAGDGQRCNPTRASAASRPARIRQKLHHRAGGGGVSVPPDRACKAHAFPLGGCVKSGISPPRKIWRRRGLRTLAVWRKLGLGVCECRLCDPIAGITLTWQFRCEGRDLLAGSRGPTLRETFSGIWQAPPQSLAWWFFAAVMWWLAKTRIPACGGRFSAAYPKRVRTHPPLLRKPSITILSLPAAACVQDRSLSE
jgi:hypothetical protein